jgi:hypothetical protein
MAGSYKHAVTDDGKLRNPETMTIATETQGDAFETIEEMYGMIWWLAHQIPGNDVELVELARIHYREGLGLSPGLEEDDG